MSTVSVPNTFAGLSGNQLASLIDANFTALVSAINAGKFSSAAYTPTVTDTFVGGSPNTVTSDCTASNSHAATLTGNFTYAVSGMSDGQTITVGLIQDGTGGRVVTWPGAWKWLIGTVPTLSTSAGAIDILTLTRLGTTYFAALAKGFA